MELATAQRRLRDGTSGDDGALTVEFSIGSNNWDIGAADRSYWL